jgi:hypothetical protein
VSAEKEEEKEQSVTVVAARQDADYWADVLRAHGFAAQVVALRAAFAVVVPEGRYAAARAVLGECA